MGSVWFFEHPFIAVKGDDSYGVRVHNGSFTVNKLYVYIIYCIVCLLYKTCLAG